MKPERRIVGSIIPTKEIKIAACMLLAMVEISIPTDRLSIIYNIDSASSSIILPLTESPNTSHERISIRITLMKERRKYGTTLPRIICIGRRGETSSTSMVPNSFSRVIVTDVMRAHISISIMVITPGTNMC